MLSPIDPIDETLGSAEDKRLFACDLAAIAAEQRGEHQKLARALFGEGFLERHELDDGYAWRFEAQEYPRLVSFVANERRCCPFFRFVIDVSPANGPLWLRITGSARVKAFVAAEFIV
jgi:hypothetical protein